MSAAAASENVKEKVAFDLMTKIAQEERAQSNGATEPPKEYYLTLYCQCLRVVCGEDAKDVLEEDSD